MFQNNNGAIVKQLAKKSFNANRRRNMFVILTLVLTAFMITSVFSIGSSYIRTTELQQLRFMGTNAHAALTNPDENQMNILQTKLSDYVAETWQMPRIFFRKFFLDMFKLIQGSKMRNIEKRG